MAQQLAWALIEVRHYGDALVRSESVSYEAQVRPEKAIIRAVIHWQTQEHEQALSDFDTGVAARPEWANSNWVKSLYSPLVWQRIQKHPGDAGRERTAKTEDPSRRKQVRRSRGESLPANPTGPDGFRIAGYRPTLMCLKLQMRISELEERITDRREFFNGR
jgi:hypothetical protein